VTISFAAQYVQKTEKSRKCDGSAKNVEFHSIHGHEMSHPWRILQLSI